MARREAYTEVVKANQHRPAHVVGKGDVVFRRFECLNPNCVNTLVVPEDECLADEFRIECSACGFFHIAGEVEPLFEYKLVDKRTGATINEGPFDASHDTYIGGAERVKYCIDCYTLQPLDNFHRHKARVNSERQGECNACKQIYNSFKNESRLTEQHQEAAETRRLLTALSGETSVGNSDDLLDRFDHQCFNCQRPLADQRNGADGYHLDHTLPVSWLWPLDHGPTVLCAKCNGAKRDRWPSDFYGAKPERLRALSSRTGIPFDVLAGPPHFNPAAVERLHDDADGIIERSIAKPLKLRALRLKIIAATGEDVFRDASPQSLRAIGIEP